MTGVVSFKEEGRAEDERKRVMNYRGRRRGNMLGVGDGGGKKGRQTAKVRRRRRDLPGDGDTAKETAIRGRRAQLNVINAPVSVWKQGKLALQ